jgi:hypothetical protein
MKSSILVLVLFSFVVFFSCKRDDTDPYPCPADNLTSANYLCASVNGNKFITVGGSELLKPYLAGFVADFIDLIDYSPLPGWNFYANNFKTDERIAFKLKYPFKFDTKITNMNFNNSDDATNGAFYLEYKNGNSFYHSDSLSKGYIIMSGSIYTTWKSARFEIDVVNNNNPQDRIKITEGRFYLGDYLKDLY